MSFLQKAYSRDDLISFLKEDFLPDFVADTRPVRTHEKSLLKLVHKLGSSNSARITIFEAVCDDSDHKKRVAITQDAFRMLKDTATRNAIVVFYSEKSSNWRLSLLTSTFELDSKGKVISKVSNPRRFSYLLGESAKTVTPHKYLVAKGRITDLADLQKRFAIEVVNNDFYKEIVKLYDELVGTDKTQATIRYPGQGEVAHQFTVRLIGRIIFCWFLREKRSKNGIPLIPEVILSRKAANTENYYHSVLAPLFFEVLNKREPSRETSFREGLYNTVPYLNGGLFSPDADDHYKFDKVSQISEPDIIDIPDSWLRRLFDLLELYNFTVDENTSYDVDLSIDPEMLGRIFENLLARINPETGETVRKMTGSFYTPREIVEYMVDESLKQYLKNKTNIEDKKLKAIVSFDLEDDKEFPLTINEKQLITEALSTVKILDPACGSGAFPIGILQKIVFVLQQVDPDSSLWLEKQLVGASPELRHLLEREFHNKNFDYLRKIGVIRESIYGVDIQPIATEVSRLRCFLTLIVDQSVDDSEPNMGIEPLPNLDFKFVTANSLLRLNGDETMVGASTETQTGLFEDSSGISDLRELRDDYFSSHSTEREALKLRFMERQNQMLQDMLANHRSGFSELTQKLSTWKPFTHKLTNWFDPEWMFGISEGFDVVIGNPPYVKNTRLSKQEKEQYNSLYNTTFDQWDLYIIFFELAHLSLSRDGAACLISPNQWLSAKYGTKLREYLVSHVLSLTDFRRYADFENASVNTFVTLFSKNNSSENLRVIVFDETGGSVASSIQRSEAKLLSHNLGALLSNDYAVIDRINKSCKNTFGTYYSVGHSFSIPDFYKLTELVYENPTPSNVDELKLVSTGTLSFLGLDYGKKVFKYDGKNYTHPVVKKNDFSKMFPTRIIQSGPKLIISSMGGLKIDIDIDGSYLGTRPTMWLAEKADKKLTLAFAILNSKFIDWYYKQLYSVAGMTGFKVRYSQIQDTPFPEAENKMEQELVRLVDEIIDIKQKDKETSCDELFKQIDAVVYKFYGLNENEIKIIEASSQ